jgi:hypothetical protein
MSTQAPILFEARFRWAILQEMKPLGELLLGSSNDRFDELYATVRDAVWEFASKLVREREPGKDQVFVDPLKVDLADVRYLARPFVLGIVDDMVNSPTEADAHEGLAG